MVNAAQEEGCRNIMLMNGTTSYAAPMGQANSLQMLEIENKFGLMTGLSDHATVKIASIEHNFKETDVRQKQLGVVLDPKNLDGAPRTEGVYPIGRTGRRWN